MNKTKYILCLFLSFILIGCQKSIEPIQVKEDIHIEFFYLETCSDCKAFKEKGIPYLEKTFGDRLVIDQYDLDSDGVEVPYDKVLDNIEGFDYEQYGFGPFIVVDGYFTLLGYTAGDEEYIVEDILLAIDGKELGYELEGRRCLFK